MIIITEYPIKALLKRLFSMGSCTFISLPKVETAWQRFDLRNATKDTIQKLDN